MQCPKFSKNKLVIPIMHSCEQHVLKETTSRKVFHLVTLTIGAFFSPVRLASFALLVVLTKKSHENEDITRDIINKAAYESPKTSRSC